MNFIKRAFSPFEQMLAAVAIFALVLSLVYGAFPFAYAEDDVETEVTTEEETVVEEPMLMMLKGPKPPQEEPKVKICHATPNGYDNGKKEVDESSIFGERGHDGHRDGGADGRGDIIPAFGDYPGLNWDTVGKLIYNNDCKAAGTITVNKIVTGNNAVDDGDFELKVGKEKVKDEEGKMFDVGTYTVTEKAKGEVPTNFTATFSGDCNANGEITIGLGENKTCVVTNAYVPPPVDVCPNIEGAQSSIPEGMMKDESGNCVMIPPPDEEYVTIIAHKIVCTDEADLPNWGTGGPDITGTTASSWVSAHESCEFASGWNFEWGPQSAFDPGDTLVGTAGTPWTTFGPTDSSGKAETSISEETLGGNTYLWFREVLKDGYLPFTHDQNGNTNADDKTAEVYCHTDVMNYDNYDRIDGVSPDHTYYCVAWNVQKETPKLCKVTIVSDTDTTVVEKAGADAKILSWIHPAWTAIISGASWIWGDDPVQPPVNGVTQNFERTFGWNGPVTSAKLTIAADNTFVAELNGDAVGSDLTEYNYKAPAKEYDVTSLIDQGNNKLGVEVYNMIHSTDPKSNPAGLLYKLEVTGTNPECNIPYEEEILGCMDEEANNYDPEATKDDGSCTYDEPSVCKIGNNLLANSSFETPVVDTDAKWDIFSSGTDWTVTWAGAFVGAPATANMELHRGVNGWLPSEGSQYAELDSDWGGPTVNQPGVEAASTRIAQTVATVPGNTYGLSFDYAPRPGTGTGDNMLEVLIGGDSKGVIVADGSAMSNTTWEDFGYVFEADSASTEVAFRDAGTPNSLGTLLDNVSLCLLEENQNDNLIEGYKWNDEDDDGVWDEETEDGLAGWTIQVTNGEDTYSTTTRTDGYYSFMVPDGSWTVTEVNQSGWEQTAPEGTSCYFQFGKPIYTRTAMSDDDSSDDTYNDSECNFGNHQTDEEPELACSLTASANPVYKGNNFDLIWTTTGAGLVELDDVTVALNGSKTTSITEPTTFTLTVWDEQENHTECSLTVNTRSSGGGGGGKKVKLVDDEVLGDSTSNGPDGEVLGDSTSIMPLGAPNTGAGGTAEDTTLPLMLALVGIIASLALIRATKNA